MTDQPRTLMIDQALFGYADGHRQLAASVELTPSDVYDLATQSDLASGARLAPDTSYIGGFTLKDSGAFAYIKTWPAPEMSRPGCVWSHALILSRSFLSRQVDLGCLQQLLRRPDQKHDLAAYRSKINVKSLSRSISADAERVEEISSAYYGSEQIMLTELPDSDFERALLAVWSQQWPKLRSTFLFRTVFDSTVALDRGLIIRITSPDTRVQPNVANDASQADWLSAAVTDAVSQSITPLRRFLWRYGKDVARPRTAFGPLVSLHLAVKRGDATERSIATISRWFPKTLDAATLKRDLLGVSAGVLPLIPRVSGSAFVNLATRFDVVGAGLVTSDELSDVVAGFAQEEMKGAVVALDALRSSLTPEGILIKEAVMRSIGPQAFADEDLPSQFVIDVLRARPELIEEIGVDRLDEAEIIALLDIAPNRHAVRRLLRKLLVVQPLHGAGEAVRRFVVDAFVEAVRLSMNDALQHGWRRFFLQVSRKVISEGLRELSGSREVSHAITLVQFSTAIDETPRQIADAAKRPGPEATIDESVALDAYLLVLSLKQGLSSSMPIVLDILPRLRLVALDNSFQTRTRDLLDRYLPHLPDAWDLNKRLLKILRKSHRDGYGLSEAIQVMNLSDEELSYVYNKERHDLQSTISRLLFPW